MSLFATVLFVLAAMAALVTIWKSLFAALPGIRALRAELAGNIDGQVVHVSTLDPRAAPRHARRSRCLKQPKPVTHRMHRYPHRAALAA